MTNNHPSFKQGQAQASIAWADVLDAYEAVAHEKLDFEAGVKAALEECEALIARFRGKLRIANTVFFRAGFLDYAMRRIVKIAADERENGPDIRE